MSSGNSAMLIALLIAVAVGLLFVLLPRLIDWLCRLRR